MLQLTNPIPESIRDSKKLGILFKKYNIMPYYGTTDESSHSMLRLLYDVSSVSQSHVACKLNIISYAFGEQLDIKQPHISGFYDTENLDNKLDRSTKVSYIEALRGMGLRLTDIIKYTKSGYHHYTDSGNAWFIVRLVKAGGESKVYIEPVHYTQVALLVPRSGSNNLKNAIVTEYWDEDYWRQRKPKVYPVTDMFAEEWNWRERGNGTIFETIVHIKNNADKSKFYGRPDTLSVLNYMYSEYAFSDVSAKISGTEFVTKKVLAFEELDPTRYDGDEEDKIMQHRRRMNSLRGLMTREGDHLQAKSLAGIEYPFGQKPPIAIDLELNRDWAWKDKELDRASSYIYAMHGWEKQLTGMKEVKSNTGSNIVIDLFNIKNVTTITPLQKFWENIWGWMLNEIGSVLLPSQEMYSIKFQDKIKELVNMLALTQDADVVAQLNYNLKSGARVDVKDSSAAANKDLIKNTLNEDTDAEAEE